MGDDAIIFSFVLEFALFGGDDGVTPSRTVSCALFCVLFCGEGGHRHLYPCTVRCFL